MDPLTQLLILANTIAETVKLAIEGQEPAVRAELWRMYLEDVKELRAIIKTLIHTLAPKEPQ